VPTVAYLFSEVRQKLREEHAGKSGEEIAALRHRGESVTRREEIPLLAYTGDCGREIFEAAPEILRARVLLIECSFLLADDLDRAPSAGTSISRTSSSMPTASSTRRSC
jgi:ribonuclease Z